VLAGLQYLHRVELVKLSVKYVCFFNYEGFSYRAREIVL